MSKYRIIKKELNDQVRYVVEKKTEVTRVNTNGWTTLGSAYDEEYCHVLITEDKLNGVIGNLIYEE